MLQYREHSCSTSTALQCSLLCLLRSPLNHRHHLWACRQELHSIARCKEVLWISLATVCLEIALLRIAVDLADLLLAIRLNRSVRGNAKAVILTEMRLPSESIHPLILYILEGSLPALIRPPRGEAQVLAD